MERDELITATAKYLAAVADVVPTDHPLSVALRQSAAMVSSSGRASAMAQYLKVYNEVAAEVGRNKAQPQLDFSDLIGPA